MRLVANLLCEHDWARAAAAERGVVLPPVSPRLVAATSALGTLMGVFGSPGDTLWTPAPVPPSRLPAADTLPLETGPLGDLPPAPLLAWGVTDAVARAQAASCALRAAAVPGDWVEALGWCRPPTAATQRRVCDRRRQQDVARRLGHALPGAAVVTRPDDVERLCAERAGGADASPTGRWVVKAPWSAAGRDRLRGRRDGFTPQVKDRLRRLLTLHGDLVFEPWTDRTAEFGAVALVVAGTVRIVGFHRQETAGGGAVRAIRPLGGEPSPEGLADDEAAGLHEAVHGVGGWLAAEGYEGPFGLDAWRHRDVEGRERFHPIGEINARLTLGAVARRLAERRDRDWDPRGATPAPALRFGSGADLAAAGEFATPLVMGDRDADLAAWLS